MIGPMRAFRLVAASLIVLTSACSPAPPPEVLKLDRGQLTVNNNSVEEWRNVEIWVNNYYRAVVPSIAPHGVFQVQLDSFISGYGRRFDYRGAQIKDLRLSARRPNGEVLDVKKEFQGPLLNDALGGQR
jgi:hypothetical protein